MYKLTQSEGVSWIELKQDYKESRRKMVNYIANEKVSKASKHNRANLEISRSMDRELEDRIKDIEQKCLYEFNTASEDIIAKAILTNRQRQVVQLRQKYTITEIALKLGMKNPSVFDIYQEALKKIEKYLKSEEKELNALSPQQKIIYKMIQIGKTNKEIMDKLDMKRNVFYMQKKRIEEKLELVSTKSPNKH